MKKVSYIFVLFTIILSFFLWEVSVFGNCSYNGWASIVWNLEWCLEWDDSLLVDPLDGKIESWIKQKFVDWTTSIAAALSLFAIWAIVYGGLMMTISVWEEEKIKKWKDIVKWAILWFIAAISAWAIVRLIVELIFGIAA